MKNIQLNLQRHFGGGEVYTAFLCRALSQLSVPCHLVVHEAAGFWSRLQLPEAVCIHRVASTDEALSCIQSMGQGWVLGHGPLPEPFLSTLSSGFLRTAIAHMPVQGRNPAVYLGHDMVFPVSGWVMQGLQEHGLPAWAEPLYGVADLTGRPGQASLQKQSRYDWDRRKGRDRLLGWLEPWVSPWLPKPVFERAGGLTLGIVSRLTPIKQFPELFKHLVPILKGQGEVHLEIFGSGGYASVRDLDRVVRPLGDRVRFWGQQTNVGQIYRQLDFLMTGLPEKEALGLNVIEAQACGCPVLGVDAPPFTETVLHGRTGYLYQDPRHDGGAGFAEVLEQCRRERQHPDPLQAPDHLARFGFAAFLERLRTVVAWARSGVSR